MAPGIPSRARQVDAAVLVPVFRDPARGVVVVLTERHAGLRKHAGQISFPGGRRDPGEDLRTTALREAEEEVGLPRERVDVVAELPVVVTLGTGFRVHPWLGVIEAGTTWVPQEKEVAQVLELSVDELRAGRRWRPLPAQGVPVPTTHFVVDGHLVWGATARILDPLLGRVESYL